MTTNYLGQKGYTIYKSNITSAKQQQIKNELTIKPFIQGAPTGSAVTFPAYRETTNKLYVPHYYGVQQFGPPPEIKISQGTNINLLFTGQLRDYQRPVVEKYLNHVQSEEVAGGLLELPCAWGKTSGSVYILSQLNKTTIVIIH